MVEGPKVAIKCQRMQCLVGQQLFRIDCGTTGSNLPIISVVPSTVDRVVSVGKELFIVLSMGSSLRLHFGMSGTQDIVERKSTHTADYAKKHYKPLSFSLHFTDFKVSFYESTISLKNSLYLDIALGRIDRDIMAPRLDSFGIVNLLRDDSRPLLEAVMDQTIIPGVGNVIKCEALHQSRLHPETATSAVDPARLLSLVGALRRFSLDWYGCALKGTEVGKRVYGRRSCECGGNVTVVRSGDSDRITYFCGACQSPDTSSQENESRCKLFEDSNCAGKKRKAETAEAINLKKLVVSKFNMIPL